MRLVAAQLNSTVGDFRGNYERMDRVLKATTKSADLVVFPECALCGYPPQDLLDYPDFSLEATKWADRLAHENPESRFLVGSIETNSSGHGRPLRNVALFAEGGRITRRYYKRLLPTYDVFDEDRFFEPGDRPLVLDLEGKKVGITICEDIWAEAQNGPSLHRYHQNPLLELSGVDLLVNISASPFVSSQVQRKREMIRNISTKYGVAVLYLNAVGANDSLIFDGRSYCFGSRGEMLCEALAFQEEIIQIDFPSFQTSFVERPPIDEVRSVYDALCLGIKDYCRKQNFNSVVLGMSGGIDSSVVACLAADALGAENVVGVLLPSRFTSGASNEDALNLARVMQNPIHLIPIEAMHSVGLQLLSKAFEGLDSDTTEENLQSRIRGTLLMALSNKFGHLPLSTGNKSELATGYCTLYGDMNGGLAPLSDVYKTQVYALGREANRRWNRIPERVFERAPTAELKPNQFDQDTLPPYERLDRMLKRIIEGFASRDELIREGCAEDEVDKLFLLISRSEFKRYQMPLGLKVSSKAFGVGRRIPLAEQFLVRTSHL